MTVQTKPFGTIEVDDRQNLLFPHGLFGFEHLNRFVLLDSAQPPFYWLQSLDDPGVAFVLIDPKIVRPDYFLEIPIGELEEIDLSDAEDALIFAIVTIPEDQAKMTANLQGPIAINRENKLGRQSISTSSRWLVKHYILEEMAAVRTQAC